MWVSSAGVEAVSATRDGFGARGLWLGAAEEATAEVVSWRGKRRRGLGERGKGDVLPGEGARRLQSVAGTDDTSPCCLSSHS